MTLVEGLANILQAVYMLAFIYGVVILIEASWSLRSSQTADVLNGILAALFLALGPSLISTLFFVFSLPGAFDIW